MSTSSLSQERPILVRFKAVLTTLQVFVSNKSALSATFWLIVVTYQSCRSVGTSFVHLGDRTYQYVDRSK